MSISQNGYARENIVGAPWELMLLVDNEQVCSRD